MIGSMEIKCVAHSPNKPLTPVFSFRNSPSSLRLLDIPKNVGTWSITSVYIIVKNPDNTTSQIDCVRTGNVWVGTFNGCTTSGKVLQGVSIMADGVDENNQPVEGYCLGKADYYVIEGDADIKALVGKTSMRLLDSLPTSPVKGDVVELDGAFQMFDGSEWVGFGGNVDLSDYYTKEEIDSTLSNYATSESVNASLSALASSFNDSLDAVNASVSALDLNVSALSTSVSRLASSVTSLSSTKRDYTDRTWKYTKTTDPVMYGVKKFFVTRDEDGQQSHSYDLTDFDETNKVWSEYEAPITIKAYSPSLYAVIDENNPHTFEYDDEEYNGWEFYRFNDSDTSFTVSGGGANIEYHINLTRRSDDTFAMESGVSEKRDYDDITWNYPMDADNDMFGVGYFTVDTGTQTYLREFSNVVVDDDVYKTWQSTGTNGWKIDTVDGHHYNLYRITSGTSAKVGEFTRTSDTNLSWDVSIGSSNEVLVRAYRREPGTLAVYQPNVNDASQRYLMFGQSSSSAGVVICDDVSAKANSFIKVDDMMITGPNYTSSRGVEMRGGVRTADTNHLKVNGSAIAFTAEVEAMASTFGTDISAIQSAMSEINGEISTISEGLSSVQGEVSTIASSFSTMASSFSTMAGSISTIGADVSTLNASVSALDEMVSSISLSVGYIDEHMSGIDGQLSAMASSMSGKRDYYNRVYPAINNNPSERFGISGWTFQFTMDSEHSDYPSRFTLDIYSQSGDYGIWKANDEWRSDWYKVRTSDGEYFEFYEDPSLLISVPHWSPKYGLSQVLADGFKIDRILYHPNGLYQSPLYVTANVENTTFALTTDLSSLATRSALGVVSASVSTMASSISNVESSVSALASSVSSLASSVSSLASSVSSLASSVSSLASSMSGKRDYLDLGYSYTSTSTSTVAVPFYASMMIGSTASETNAYRGNITLVYDDGSGSGETYTATYVPGQMETDGYWECESGNYITWEDQGNGNGYEFFIDEYINMGKPNDGDTTWVGGNIDYEEQSLTLTMPTSTSTSTVTVSDTLALTGSVSSMLSSYAPASSLNVSGIGCSTVTMSGVFANSSSFSYNFVVQPNA